MNQKLTKVNPWIEQGAYIKGSSAGNFFLIASETAKGIVAFRPLKTAIPPLGAKPATGVETRVRVVPATTPSQKLDTLMERFGFGRVNGGSTPIHYSKVTSDAKAAIGDANLALELAG